ncbi:Phage protein [Alloalcanivorax xenomutans]|uniref:DUF1073 domain-containing protein n=1 Tax=Alloalcanivorax xenomutans TaxID=1094342 RepID=UPI0006D5C3C8|nr:DUF1073 domain-containing protein [Alloalcanivorax xenomutans]CUR48483.1 Phage protein [Alloalcanivorax xenomutans]
MAEKPRIRVPATTDGLENLVANIGTARDKRSANQFTFGQWSFYDLENAYTENWIAKQIVNVPVDDGVREGRAWNHDEAETIAEEEERLELFGAYQEGRYWARLYGGAGILMVTDQPLDQPLNIQRIKRGGLKRLVVLDRWDLVPTDWNFYNPLQENYLLPEWYNIIGGESRIHHTHIIRCDGEVLPRRARIWNQGWGDSTLRRVLEDVKDCAATKGGIASLVLEANVDVITRNGLSNELASDQELVLMKRYALAARMKSLVNNLLLDGEETYDRKSITFSGLSQILEQFMVWMSGAADIPMTRLFGRSAAGLSATGEGDMNNYYDNVRSMQNTQFRRELKVLDQVMVRSALGEWPEDISYEWNPLYQESDTEKAQRELSRAQAEDIRIEQGVLRPSMVAARLKSEGAYPISDDDIDRLQKREQEEDNGAFDPEGGADPFGNPDGDEPGAVPEEEETPPGTPKPEG